MKRRYVLAVLTGVVLTPVTPVCAVTAHGGAGIVPDSALAELKAGRFWHATRILRAAGAANGPPGDVLLLARAEAGWHHWVAVRDLLHGRSWLGDEERGEGWRLLGRAREEAGDWQGAAAAYTHYLRAAPGDAPELAAIEARRARALARSGHTDEAVKALEAIDSSADPVPSWTAAELVRNDAALGDTAGVRKLLPLVVDPAALASTWRARADARLAAGDTTGAEQAFRTAMRSVSGSRHGTAAVELGLLEVARGDSARGRSLLLAGLPDAGSDATRRAAAALLRIGSPGRALSAELARILARSGDSDGALKAYDRAVTLSRRAHVAPSPRVQLARARLMAAVPGREDEAVRELRALSTSRDERIGAASLQTWAQLRRRQGREQDVKILRGWLLERYPSSPEALEVRWERAARDLDRGRTGAALEELHAIVRAAPTRSRAGDARMRIGQIELARGRLHQASEVYHEYLRRFPEGRHWEEASYWAARTDLDLGDATGAHRLIAGIRRVEPISYYAVLGAQLLGEPFEVSVPSGTAPVRPAWLGDGLRRLDLLRAAGLSSGEDAEVRRLEERAARSESATLSLADGLIDRGRTVDGINLGWKLRREGHPWDLQLLKVVYPLPYRTLVMREAEDAKVDPLLLVALIRQESGFDAKVVSSAGAVGLMQVMLPTARALARRDGPADLSAKSLTAPDVNLHLGTAFLREMDRRYHGDLPLVLSAYNAGPTWATRWSHYSDVKSAQSFVERIPFPETRGYVKNVQRNLGVYHALYGLD